MKEKVKEMLKNVIEENAIQFKASTSDALYNKIGNRLKDEYKTVAKKMFNSLQESTYGSGSSIAQGVGSSEEVSAMTVDEPLGLPPGSPISGDAPPIPRGPNGEQGMTLDEFVKQYHRKKEDFDSREEWTEWLQEYYKQMVDLLQQWDREYQWQRRNNTTENRPKPMKIPTWKQFKQKEEQQPLPKRWLDQPV